MMVYWILLGVEAIGRVHWKYGKDIKAIFFERRALSNEANFFDLSSCNFMKLLSTGISILFC
jgi:hypothetical protein